LATDAGASKRALIVGLLGAGCYPLSLLGAMLGLRAFLGLSTPGTPGRGLAIVAMLMPGLMLPVTCVEVALAKPGVRHSQIAKWQPECRAELTRIWAAEQGYHSATSRYTEDPAELQAIKPPPAQHYSYVLGTHAWLVHDDETAKSHLDQLRKLHIPVGEDGDTFTIACIARVRDWIDVWTVTSEDRDLEGGKAVLPAGTPHNDYSGFAK
jgi:hypothetical protein